MSLAHTCHRLVHKTGIFLQYLCNPHHHGYTRLKTPHTVVHKRTDDLMKGVIKRGNTSLPNTVRTTQCKLRKLILASYWLQQSTNLSAFGNLICSSIIQEESTLLMLRGLSLFPFALDCSFAFVFLVLCFRLYASTLVLSLEMVYAEHSRYSTLTTIFGACSAKWPLTSSKNKEQGIQGIRGWRRL